MTLMTQEEFKDAKNTYHAFLKTHVAHVRFKKVNGDIRDMRCTLREDLIPAEVEGITPKRQRDTNDEVVAVYDIDAEGWRSFRIDSVIAFGSAEEVHV